MIFARHVGNLWNPVFTNSRVPSRLVRWRGDRRLSRHAILDIICRPFQFPAPSIGTHTNIMQRSLVLLKPDCVQRRLIGEIISRFERKGLNIVAMKMLQVTPELSKQHYAEHVDKPFYPSLESFITSSPIVALAVDGLEAITVIREMLGATSGLKAAMGTIRGDYSGSRQMNLVHASDGPEAAKRELDLYFESSDFCDYEPVLTPSLRASDE